MTNVIRNLHRLTGALGSPGSVQPSGVIALNFAPSGTPELWASDGSAWKQLNPAASTPFSTGAENLTGTEAAKAVSPASLAAAAAASSAGVADADKYVRLDAAGKIAASLLDSTALTTALAPVATATSAGIADANKFVLLDANGKLDPSVLSVSAMEYKGGADITGVAPASPSIGDTYVITTGGAFTVSWGLTGNGAVGDMLIYNGTGWDLVQASNPDLSGYMPLGGTATVAGAAMTSGAVITMNPASAGNTVFNAAGGAITNAVLDCGTF